LSEVNDRDVAVVPLCPIQSANLYTFRVILCPLPSVDKLLDSETTLVDLSDVERYDENSRRQVTLAVPDLGVVENLFDSVQHPLRMGRIVRRRTGLPGLRTWQLDQQA